MTAPAPFTPDQLRAAIDSLPENMRAIFAAVAPEMEIDTDKRPGVVVCDTGTHLVIATPWKPNKALFGDRNDPTSYLGIITTGTRANWGTLAAPTGKGMEALGAWTIVAHDDNTRAIAAGVVALLVKAGYSVSKAPTMPALFDAIRTLRARAPMRLAKKGRRKAEPLDLSSGPRTPSTLDLSSIPDAEVAADPRA